MRPLHPFSFWLIDLAALYGKTVLTVAISFPPIFCLSLHSDSHEYHSTEFSTYRFTTDPYITGPRCHSSQLTVLDSCWHDPSLPPWNTFFTWVPSVLVPWAPSQPPLTVLPHLPELPASACPRASSLLCSDLLPRCWSQPAPWLQVSPMWWSFPNTHLQSRILLLNSTFIHSVQFLLDTSTGRVNRFMSVSTSPKPNSWFLPPNLLNSKSFPS